MSTLEAYRALTRFGLFPRPGEARAVAADPRGHLEEQLTRPLEPISGLTPSAEGHLLRHRFLFRRRIEREGGPPAEEVAKAFRQTARKDMLAWIAHVTRGRARLRGAGSPCSSPTTCSCPTSSVA